MTVISLYLLKSIIGIIEQNNLLRKGRSLLSPSGSVMII